MLLIYMQINPIHHRGDGQAQGVGVAGVLGRGWHAARGLVMRGSAIFAQVPGSRWHISVGFQPATGFVCADLAATRAKSSRITARTAARTGRRAASGWHPSGQATQP